MAAEDITTSAPGENIGGSGEADLQWPFKTNLNALNAIAKLIEGGAGGGGGAVTSVNGQTGVVVVTKADVGLGSVENTALSTWAGSAALTNFAVGAVSDSETSLSVKPAVTVAATTNQALTGTPTIDGTATAVGSVALLTGQTAPAENGPWVVAAGAWARPSWYPAGGTTQAFQFITTFVRLGTLYQGSTWRITSTGAVTIDTTATTWAIAPLALNSSTITGLLPDANLSANVPLLSAANIFTANQRISAAEPRLIYAETDQATDEKLWDWDLQAKTLTLRTRTDADGAGVTALSFVRGTGTALASGAFGAIPISFSGILSAATGSINLASSLPGISFNETDAASGARVWRMFANGSQMFWDLTNDAGASGKTVFFATRSGGTLTAVGIGASDNPTITLGGTGNVTTGGQIIISTAGKGLSIAEGSNAKAGIVTLVGGTAVVTTTAVLTNSRISLNVQSLGTVSVPSALGVSARTNATSFTILASAPTDTSVIYWDITEAS